VLELPPSEPGENKDRRTYSDNLRGYCCGLGRDTHADRDDGFKAGGFGAVRDDEATFPGILKFALLEGLVGFRAAFRTFAGTKTG
jgi:hypothetical protein